MRRRLLYASLCQINPGLAEQFDEIYDAAVNIWAEQLPKEFTAHGQPHIEQVEENLDRLILPGASYSECKLNAQEIFVLLCATCLHDIGMQLVDIPNSREEHAQRSYELIMGQSLNGFKVDLPIYDDTSREAIATIARAHWIDFALSLDEIDYLGNNVKGQLRLLGLLLTTADLFDLSPLRARFFRSKHRLYSLPPLSELHQRMHNLVRGCEINRAPKTNDCFFEVSWRGNDGLIHEISDWVFKVLDGYWLRLNQPLKESSHGIIRWREPWYQPSFNERLASTYLPKTVADTLRAEIISKKLINRTWFVDKFKEALTGKFLSQLFIITKDVEFDGPIVMDWCEAAGQVCDNFSVAKVNVSPSLITTESSIVAILLSQWGGVEESLKQNPPKEEEAIVRFNKFTQQQMCNLVCFISTSDHNDPFISKLISSFCRSSKKNNYSRIFVLMTNDTMEAEGRFSRYKPVCLANNRYEKEDIVEHFISYGFNAEESENYFDQIEEIEIDNKPALIYTFINRICSRQRFAQSRDLI